MKDLIVRTEDPWTRMPIEVLLEAISCLFIKLDLMGLMEVFEKIEAICWMMFVDQQNLQYGFIGNWTWSGSTVFLSNKIISSRLCQYRAALQWSGIFPWRTLCIMVLLLIMKKSPKDPDTIWKIRLRLNPKILYSLNPGVFLEKCIWTLFDLLIRINSLFYCNTFLYHVFPSQQ